MPTLNRISHQSPLKEKRRSWGIDQKQDIKFYQSKYWRGVRAWILSEEPLCRECKNAGKLTSAKVVDHIRKRHDGGTEERENLQPLCSSCHNRKSAKERHGITN